MRINLHLSILSGFPLLIIALFTTSSNGADPAATVRATSPRPNVVIILADDLGYGSLSCYGSPSSILHTPHIDQLAQQGRRFTDAYTPSSVCSPTRYALLTGRYVWRSGVTGGVYGVSDPLHIETTRPTLSSLFKSQGFNTAAIGKWHLGLGADAETDFTKPLSPGARDLGFDYDFLIPQNHGDVSGVFIENDAVAGLRSSKIVPAGISPYGKEFIGIDAPQRVDAEVMSVLTDKAVSWLGQQSAGKPFFLYFAPVAAHEPITPSSATRGKSGCGTYGDFILDLDLSVGRILAELDRLVVSKDTIVLFTSDNGGEIGKTRSGEQQAAIAAGLNINGKLRGGKHGIFEGGLRIPYIVRWPGHIPGNSECALTVNLVDTFRTLATAIQAPLPPYNPGAEDSVNVLDAWLDLAKEPVRKAMIINSEDGMFALRQGPWKYIEGIPSKIKKPSKDQATPKPFVAQLFRLDIDIAETTDVLASQPEIVRQMKQLVDASRSTSGSYQLLGNTHEK